MRTSLDYELTYLEAGTEELKNYLLSKELFWPTSLKVVRNMPPYPELTLGNLLLSQTLACTLMTNTTTTSEQTIRQQKYDAHIDETRNRWRVAWENKANREYISRLRQWSETLKEFRDDYKKNAMYYPAQVRLRVLLELLRCELNTSQFQDSGLEGLDNLLRRLFKDGDFVWQGDVASGFPKDVYWYLWGSLKVIVG